MQIFPIDCAVVVWVVFGLLVVWDEDGNDCGLIVLCVEASNGCAVLEYGGVV